MTNIAESTVHAKAVNPAEPKAKLPKRVRTAKAIVQTDQSLPSDKIFVRLDHPDDHIVSANEGVGFFTGAVADLINDITVEWRLRQRWHRAEKSLILQGKALCRHWVDGDKGAASDLFDRTFDGKELNPVYVDALQPFIASINHFREKRETIEKKLCKMARKLPAYAWVKDVYGIGDQGYASLIGEAGDITKYKSVAAVWKRMGVAVIDGGRQRRIADADKALEHGYSPARRSVMWNIGGGLIGGMGKGVRPVSGEDISQREDWSEYQKLFVERCRYLVNLDPAKYSRGTVEKASKATGEVRELESYSAHCSASAKRYVEKRFLRDLFAQWQNCR